MDSTSTFSAVLWHRQSSSLLFLHHTSETVHKWLSFVTLDSNRSVFNFGVGLPQGSVGLLGTIVKKYLHDWHPYYLPGMVRLVTSMRIIFKPLYMFHQLINLHQWSLLSMQLPETYYLGNQSTDFALTLLRHNWKWFGTKQQVGLLKFELPLFTNTCPSWRTLSLFEI